ncbi:hypothetical protein FI667_g1663, partial [Globisporangium splendens]
MDDTQQQQFAIMKMEQLTVLDAKSTSKNHPFEIKSLVDVFAVFGYTADDFIDRHDQCTIFKRIRGELEDLLRDLSTHTKKYDKAVLLRDRLRLIKKEFIDMQGKYERRRQDQERSQFHRGIVLARKHSDILCDARTQGSEREMQHNKLSEPHVKFSKLLLELKDTEKNLSKLRQFEDAKNVFLRADALEKEERARNTENFEKLKETKRALLREKHEQEIAQLGEKLMEKRYILMRANENHRKTQALSMLVLFFLHNQRVPADDEFAPRYEPFAHHGLAREEAVLDQRGLDGAESAPHVRHVSWSAAAEHCAGQVARSHESLQVAQP